MPLERPHKSGEEPRAAEPLPRSHDDVMNPAKELGDLRVHARLPSAPAPLAPGRDAVQHVPSVRHARERAAGVSRARVDSAVEVPRAHHARRHLELAVPVGARAHRHVVHVHLARPRDVLAEGKAVGKARGPR